MNKLPTTTRDYRINFISNTLVIDGREYGTEQAVREFPEDAAYIAWFIATYK